MHILKKEKLLYLLFFMLLAACSDTYKESLDTPGDINGEEQEESVIKADSTIAITIDTSQKFQIMDGFSASGAWTAEHVGKHWSQSNVNGIARLMFSTEIEDGQPQGIGLTQWRVNLGGGSAEQGDDSGIEDETRRMECFLGEDGEYNWEKCKGAQNFMKAAKEHGCQDFVLYSATPPYFYTRNGKCYSSYGKDCNLQKDKYDDFADFMATVAQHFEQEGYKISYISPVNEPQFNWDKGQGSGWRNSQVKNLVKELDAKLTEKGLSDTKILIGEAAKWYYLYEQGTGTQKVERERTLCIKDFFDPASAHYLGDLPHVPKLICGHSYWTDLTWNRLQDVRSKVWEEAKKYGVRTYQTEWSMMEDGYEDCPDYKTADYMDISLAMAKVMYHDIATANVSSWAYWSAMAQERWGQKNRFYLIRIIPDGGDYKPITGNGTYQAGKNLWVLGNYSLFVRPGYQRVGLTIPNQNNKFFATAYLSPNESKLVVVYTNCTEKSIKIENKYEGTDIAFKELEQYTTSKTKDLQAEPVSSKGIIPARAVATFIYKLK